MKLPVVCLFLIIIFIFLASRRASKMNHRQKPDEGPTIQADFCYTDVRPNFDLTEIDWFLVIFFVFFCLC